jgi:AAA15 family ATPase/GTPase
MQIKSIAVENFKALRASGTVRLKPLSVIIGNNGSGKSSLLEAVETYRRIVFEGVDAAMEHWQGFEHVWHKAAKPHQTSVSSMAKQSNPMKFALNLKDADVVAKLQLDVNSFNQGNLLYIQREFYEKGLNFVERTSGTAGIAGVHNSSGLMPDVERAFKTLVGGKSLLPWYF